MSDQVLTRVVGGTLRVTLNRPRAINALTQAMIDDLGAALDLAEQTPGVVSVFLEGAGDRGFCAGGDIVAMRASALAGDGAAEHFWRTEYDLDARISEFPKPVVAFMDGVVMGGGVGLASHASHRLATPNLRCAMPEVGIGFTPDVGGSWLLSRAPGEWGTHLALTGTTAGAAEAIRCGLADCEVPADAREHIVAQLANGTEPTAVVDKLGRVPDAPTADQAWIDRCFAGDDAGEIVAALLADPAEAAQAAAAIIAARSPTSVCVTLAALRRARRLPTLRACLDQELRVARHFLSQPDFVEGIRAQVVDKDRNPQWNPPRINEVAVAEVDAFFD